jgi:LmbE family N-acetylglucosaminyl deacetylase
MLFKKAMAMRRNQILILVLLFFAVIYVFGITSYFFSKAYYAISVPPLSNIAESRVTTGDRILVIAPHPDDETIGAGGLIFREKKLGKTVKVVIMTNGDGFRKAAEKIFRVGRPQPADYLELGKIRQQEAINAMANLGLTSKDVVFLGYGDGSLAALWDGYWDHTKLYKARNGYSRSPYSNSFEKNAPYCGENVVKNLREIFAGYRPTDIFYPDPDDMHPDHWATSNFVKFAVGELNYKPRLYTYLVHHYQWPVPLLYAPGAELLPPAALKSVGTDWHVYTLDREEIETKHRAMLEYKSQYKVMPEFLDAFIRRNELFGTYADASFAVDSRSDPDFVKDGDIPLQK